MKKIGLLFSAILISGSVMFFSCEKSETTEPQSLQATKFTITFITPEGATDIPTVEIDSMGRVKKPGTVMHPDSIFVEWRQASQMIDGGDDFNFKNTPIRSNLTLHSLWKEIPKFEMIAITGGTFAMGINNPESPGYGPEHQVTVTGFNVGKFEVTQKLYKIVMGENSLPVKCAFIDDEKPVHGVSWYKCLEFCNRLSIYLSKKPCYTINGSTNPDDWGAPGADWNLAKCNRTGYDGYRLPTEAEWEYAAGGGATNRTYGGGTNDFSKLDEYALTPTECGGRKNNHGPNKVGSKKPNALGMYDVLGNVSEWTFDIFLPYDPSAAALTDPIFPGTSNRVRTKSLLKGSSYYWDNVYLTTVFRDGSGPNYDAVDMGLRIVCMDL